MSSLLIDLIIWALLAVGAGFGLIGLIGLLLFPDTRSRMYTSVRATLISSAAVGLAVFIYGMNALQTSGGALYVTLILHTLLLIVVVAIGNYLISLTILEKTRNPAGNIVPMGKKSKGGNKK